MPIQPPAAIRRPHEITQHGQTRIDEYYWMRDREDPQTLAYLRAENEYLEAILDHTKPLQNQLFEEMKGRLPETDLSVPEQFGGYQYYTRLEPGKQYPIYCRKPVTSGPEQILLDQNALAEGQPFCALGAFEISPGHTHLAYIVDYNGSEDFSLYIKDLETGQLLPESIPHTIGYFYMREGLAWAGDNRTLYYTTFDHTMRPDKVYRHILGEDPALDVCVFHEPDEAYFVHLSKTRSGGFVSILLRSHNGTELRLIPSGEPDKEPILLAPRRPGLDYFADHLGESLFIITNENALNFKLVVAPAVDPRPDNWREVLPHRPEVLISSVEAFQNHLVLLERNNGLKQLRISAPDGVSNVSYVAFPEPVYNLSLARNPEFSSDRLRFTYSSFITPNSVVEWDMQTGVWNLLKQDEIPSGYDSSQYDSERLYAPAPGGKVVPISLVYRRGLKKDGQNPLLLGGYGSYGFSLDPAFNPNLLSLLDRGFVFAMAHVRGGSEMGRQWYEEGRLLYKRNTFTDFIACAEHLFELGYTSPQKLGIMGGSAGGLLVGAVLTMRPDLCRAAVARVPFVDVVTTMSDPDIPLTVIEYDQWGNPAKKDYFDYMLSYSPYDNLRPAGYPRLLMTTGLNDPRVAFWEPAKFAARLRCANTSGSLTLLKTEFDAGHGGLTGRYDSLKEVALIYAFLIDSLVES
jgi:oligopeptidase B